MKKVTITVPGEKAAQKLTKEYEKKHGNSAWGEPYVKHMEKNHPDWKKYQEHDTNVSNALANVGRKTQIAQQHTLQEKGDSFSYVYPDKTAKHLAKKLKQFGVEHSVKEHTAAHWGDGKGNKGGDTK